MIGGIAKSMLVGVARRRIDAPPVGPVTNMLLTSGLSLALTPRRRPMGLAMLAAGAVLLWRQREQAGRISPPLPGALPPPAVPGAVAATAPR